MAAPDVWIARDDGADIIRAAIVASVGRDYNGNITARLSGCDQGPLTLVADHGHDHSPTPEDFHQQLLKVVSELSDASEAAIVRPVCDPERGWRWVTERF